MESAPRAKRKPASRLTRGVANTHARSTRPPVKSQYSAPVDVARRAARCAPSVAVRPGYLPALAFTISAPSHRVEGTAPTTSCCFAFRATTELMQPDERLEGSQMVFILALLAILMLIELVVAACVAIAIITDIFDNL